MRSLFFFFLAIVITLLSTSCSKNSPGGDGPNPPVQTENFRITDIEIPAIINRQKSADVEIKSKGFKLGDVILINSIDNPSSAYTVQIKSIQSNHVIIQLPESIEDGRYRLIAQRETKTQTLANTVFNTVLRTNIPDQANKTVKGVVHVNGVGVADVVVSDGYDVAKTDQNGVYYLNSNKRIGYVFVSVPGNYEVTAMNGNLPQFYKSLYGNPNIVETIDFELTPVNNENHIMLTMADFHLANRNNDIAQFQSGFLTDVNNLIASYKAAGKKVYGLTLGDLTWDLYWYSNNFALPQYVDQINKVDKIPIFNLIGNHDYDPYFTSDWLAENAYRKTLGPTYYSFNIGRVHYIVLDNTEWINTGGGSGIVGERNYNGTISDEQMAWLAKDLAMVESSTPIVLASHIQLHNAPNATGAIPSYRISNGAQLVSELSRFEEVHILSGHTHINYKVPRNDKVIEHNTAAVSATWWWTGRSGAAGNQIAPDGSPSGYGVWEMNGNDIKWFYKSIGYENNYQFRTYDLNNVHISADTYLPNANSQHRAMLNQYAFNFANANTNNEVLINVWGYDPQWTISVTENGNPLTVERIMSRDPLHIISYSMMRLNANATPTFNSANTSHMFKVQASAPNTSLNVTVTDRFGNVYSESMTRPKSFNYSMK